MIVNMVLLSDAVLGDGHSIPGGEDITVKHDSEGFPYYAGSSLRGILREEMINYCEWTKKSRQEKSKLIDELFGFSSMQGTDGTKKIKISNFTISDNVKKIMKTELDNKDDILNSFTCLRTFTSIDETGTASEGSLRIARCVLKGVSFIGEIQCSSEDELLIREIIHYVKWIGSMRNRGFGKVKFFIGEEAQQYVYMS